MAKHPRQLIREAVRDLLVGQTAAEASVTTTQVYPFRRSDLPALSVYTLDESVDPESSKTAPRELMREVELLIAGWVAPGAGLDDAMDALALEIETAMDADPTLGGAAADSILHTTTLEPRGEGDQLTGLIQLSYVVTYRTPAEAATDEGMDDFVTAGVTYQPPNVGDDSTAEDEVVVQEVA